MCARKLSVGSAHGGKKYESAERRFGALAALGFRARFWRAMHGGGRNNKQIFGVVIARANPEAPNKIERHKN